MAERDLIGNMILEALSTKWDSAMGWDVWAEFIAPKLGVDPSNIQSVHYRTFKRSLTTASVGGLLEIVETARTPARSVWKLSEKGWALVGEDEAAGAVDKDVSDEWVKKRITREHEPLPTGVWAALMERHRAGELDIAFLPKKGTNDATTSKMTGGSGK